MLIVKVTILMWVLNLIFRLWVKNSFTKEDLLDMKFFGEIKRLTFSRIMYIITLLISLIGTVASAVWVLFLR